MKKHWIFLSLGTFIFFGIVSRANAGFTSSSDNRASCEVMGFGDSNGNSKDDYIEYWCLFSEDLEGKVTATMLDESIYASVYNLFGSNPTNEVWTFDVEGNGDKQIVIRFYERTRAVIADIYDIERDRYSFEKFDVQFEEAYDPIIRIIAKDGWWVEDDIINFNLEIEVDGSVSAAFIPIQTIQRWAKIDGEKDFKIFIQDRNHNGKPEMDWRTALAPSYYDEARTFLMVNAVDNEPAIKPWFSWPFIGPISYGYLTSSPLPFNDPPIQIDWRNGEISAVSEFVRSRGNDGQWFVYTTHELYPGELNVPNFESPFAWYDLAADTDRQPELSIRLVYYPPKDADFMGEAYDDPFNLVRYSWDQTNDGLWDYKLGLIGNHFVSTVESLPEFSLQIISYDDLPRWVTEAEWGPNFFVASESGGVTGEGIYTWDPLWNITSYYLGFSDEIESISQDDEQNFPDIPIGYRGEYSFEKRIPNLYFSPIDHKLHLLNAYQGIWRLDASRIIRFANSSGNDYIDSWNLFNEERIIRQLYSINDFLIFGGDSRVLIKQAAFNPSLFESKPPRNHDEWQQLGYLMERQQRIFSPGDFEAMVTQFEGPEWRIRGARMRSFRPDGDDFRFVLELFPEYQFDGDIGPSLEGLAPGSYLIEYNGQFQVQPLSPARVEIVPGTLRLSDPAPMAFVPVQVEAEFRNNGLEDLHNVNVQMFIYGPGASLEPIEEMVVNLLSSQGELVRFNWSPPAAGEWQIKLRIDSEGDQYVSASDSALLNVIVAEPPTLNIAWIWSISNLDHPWALGLLLAAMSLTAVFIVLSFLNWIDSKR